MNGDGDTESEGVLNSLGRTLEKIPERLADQFLLVMLGVVVVLGIAAIVRGDLSLTIVLAVVILALFFGYLLYRVLITAADSKTIARELARRVTDAILREGYVPGKQKQKDLGAALIMHVRRANLRPGIIAVVTKEFKEAFRVDEEIIS